MGKRSKAGFTLSCRKSGLFGQPFLLILFDLFSRLLDPLADLDYTLVLFLLSLFCPCFLLFFPGQSWLERDGWLGFYLMAFFCNDFFRGNRGYNFWFYFCS